MDYEAQKRLLVGDAFEPVRYRVYPETPLAEVVDLMVRRSLRALPVVGEAFEVLGIITSGDALDQVLRDRPSEEAGAPHIDGLAARDVMTRAVLCVSETQQLVEAAQMMVNRDVEQLPVVREGQLVGVITRDGILKALHLGATSGTRDETPEERQVDP
jgi:CBS domain-containing protein